MFEGVAGEFGVAVEAHFFEDALTVGAHGLDAEGVLLGDLPDGFARGDQAHDLELAVGEPFMRRGGEVFSEVERHFFGEGGADVAAAGNNLLKGADQLIRRALFGHVAGSASFEDAHGELIFGMHAQHQDRQAGFGAFDLTQHFQAAPARHGDVEHDDVPFVFPDAVEGFVGVAGLAEFGPAQSVGQDVAQASPNHCMVVHEKDFHGRFGRRRAPGDWFRLRYRAAAARRRGRRGGERLRLRLRLRLGVGLIGMRTVTVVPWPGRPLMLTWPPNKAARSRMPHRPMERVLAISASEMPRPLSWMTSRTWPASRLKRTSTRVACAWRITLVRVSWKMRKKAVFSSGCNSGNSRSPRPLHLTALRFSKSAACHSRAATRPRLSRMPGRKSVAMRRTV